MVFTSKLRGRLARMARLGPRDWADLVLACLELAGARGRLKGLDVRSFRPNRTQPSPGRPEAPRQTPDGTQDQIARVGRAIARAAEVVPWRSDCLVQAEAARHWLARKGLAADIRLGARKTAGGRLDAHAWLLCEGRIVTGGDIRAFVPFE